MTTVADYIGVGELPDSDTGQSVIEFMLLLPVVVALVVVMVRVNSAIQVSIVNQQYARAQAHWLAFNNSTFPELRQRVRNFQSPGKQSNLMILGVAGNTVAEDEPDNYHPEATVVNVARKPGGGSDEPQNEGIDSRSRVRIRTTVGMCTAPFVTSDGPLLPLNAGAPFAPTGPYNLKDSTKFDFCRRPL